MIRMMMRRQIWQQKRNNKMTEPLRDRRDLERGSILLFLAIPCHTNRFPPIVEFPPRVWSLGEKAIWRENAGESQFLQKTTNRLEKLELNFAKVLSWHFPLSRVYSYYCVSLKEHNSAKEIGKQNPSLLLSKAKRMETHRSRPVSIALHGIHSSYHTAITALWYNIDIAMYSFGTRCHWAMLSEHIMA